MKPGSHPHEKANMPEKKTMTRHYKENTKDTTEGNDTENDSFHVDRVGGVCLRPRAQAGVGGKSGALGDGGRLMGRLDDHWLVLGHRVSLVDCLLPQPGHLSQFLGRPTLLLL